MNICDSILNAFNFGAHTHSTSVWVFIYIVTLPAGLHSILYIHAYNIQYGMHNYNYCNSIHWLHTFTQFSGLQSFLKSIEKVQSVILRQNCNILCSSVSIYCEYY